MGDPGSEKSGWRGALPLLAFAGVVFLIGSNIVAIRFSNRELPPLWGAGTRFAVAATLFYLLMLSRSFAFPRGRSLVGSVLFGIVGIAAYFAFVYWGLVEVDAASGQVLLSLVPLITLFLAVVQGQERFRWAGLAGGIVAAAGIAVIFRQQAQSDVAGLAVLALVAAAVCAAQAGLFLKRFPPDNLIAANTVAMSLGAITLLALSLLADEARIIPEQWQTWTAFTYLATIGTIGTFLLTMYVLRHWSASAASYQFVLAPVVAIVLGAILLGETMSGEFFIGGGLVVAGVYFGALMSSNTRPAGDGHRN